MWQRLALTAVLWAFVRADGNPTLTDTTLNVPVSATDGTKFDLHYYTNKQFAINGGPILVHLTFGDSADNVANHQSLIYDIAKQLNATLVVVESRYYGKSTWTITGNANDLAYYSDLNVDNILADVKAVITKVRTNNEKVYLSGAGYAGELATLFRLQNTDLISGAIISNAHLKLHQGGNVALGALDKTLNTIYSTEKCDMTKLKAGFDAIATITADNNKDAVDALKLNPDITIISKFDELRNYLHAAYYGLALQNFDMEHSYTIPGSDPPKVLKFGKRPLKTYCESIQNTGGDTLAKKLEPLSKLIEAYYQTSDTDSDGKHNIRANAQPIDRRELSLKCTTAPEYTCPQADPNNYFPSVTKCEDDTTWISLLRSDCEEKFSDFTAAKFTPDYMKTKTNNFNFKDLKNTIFIDSEYDPASVGRVTDISTDQYGYLIPGANRFAHLHQPTSCDAENLKQVINILKCWNSGSTTGNCDRSKLQSKLTDYALQNSGTCSDQILAYPWGQDNTNPDQSTVAPVQSTTKSFASTTAVNLFTRLSLLSFVVFIFNGF
ncbi:Lysosomal Pro-Xaa carboxypeptidase [Aphelenchoides besseyi]|nr:Lysosomal Pro-Xaa carboxypeptidase [Aphelenchoides besseyi]KAI6193832.1 Lysosomal Pro-Xaa carboxypeptidase [Aphelenchoides besseyi]